MKLRILIVCGLFLLSGKSVLAGQDSVAPVYDTACIRDLSDQLSLRVFGVNKFNRFSIRDNALGQEVQYAPNNNLNLGLGFNYRWFGLGVAVSLPFINNDDERYGKTSRFDFQTNIITRKLLMDVYLQNYTGFYVQNPDSYLADWDNTGPYPKRPDIQTTTFGGSLVYVFRNTCYSAKAALVQNQVQKKSAGSFLLGGFFSLFTLQGDSSLVPEELDGVFDPDLLFRRVQSNNLGVAFGYTHNFVILKKLNLSLTLVPGISLQHNEADYEQQDKFYSGNQLAGKLLARLALVYNSDKSFAGITASNDSFTGTASSNKNNNVDFEVGVVRFFYGRRIALKK